MDPRRGFWTAILVYGMLSAANFLPAARTDFTSAVGGVAGILIAASAGYVLLRPDRVGGPDEWNLATLTAVAGAGLYAVVVLLGVV